MEDGTLTANGRKPENKARPGATLSSLASYPIASVLQLLSYMC